MSFPGKDADTQRRQEKPLPYPSMAVEEIAALPVDEEAARDARLFLWATNAYLPGALDVMAAWGFDYRQALVWHKTGNPSPLGGSVAPAHLEFVMVGVRGRPPLLARLDSPIVSAPKPYRHSRKPAEIRAAIERVSPGPYLELFARVGDAPPERWTCWGRGASLAA